ncbi:MAG: hypothetical protein KKG06_00370, partial [Bacteroidetes bacterium]|nr:hypothetical protein [Bacteroidota bacterium]
KGSLSLYELLDVWGYSECGWTPAMLRLRGLVVDGDPKIDNPMSFHIDYSEGNSIIYSFLYFGESTIQKGALIGKWTAPRSSPTNSVLLWPSSLVYFINQIQITTPKVFTRGAG